MTNIHSTAMIADTVELGRDVCIGPYCCVDGNVVLGDNCHLDTHVVVTGNTTIGADTRIFPFASIGHISQDLKYDGEDVSLEIGARNTIREHVTMNPGTDQGGGVTRVGDDVTQVLRRRVAVKGLGHTCEEAVAIGVDEFERPVVAEQFF